MLGADGWLLGCAGAPQRQIRSAAAAQAAAMPTLLALLPIVNLVFQVVCSIVSALARGSLSLSPCSHRHAATQPLHRADDRDCASSSCFAMTCSRVPRPPPSPVPRRMPHAHPRLVRILSRANTRSSSNSLHDPILFFNSGPSRRSCRFFLCPDGRGIPASTPKVGSPIWSPARFKQSHSRNRA